ncbi:unnamed protein product [Schistosoma margrebowiei]|uniref:Uncharacterized protein n=1 Tax=Schistosoma margrebowiei TaxID=48269 RepID=A0A183MC95_9TREM|nr:unnamed protein product [Schistosoma margrebowiei]
MNRLTVNRSKESSFHNYGQFTICVWAMILPGCPDRSRVFLRGPHPEPLT